MIADSTRINWIATISLVVAALGPASRLLADPLGDEERTQRPLPAQRISERRSPLQANEQVRAEPGISGQDGKRHQQGSVVEQPAHVVGATSDEAGSERSGVTVSGLPSRRKNLAISPRQTDRQTKRSSPLQFGPGQKNIKTVLGSLAVVLGSFFLLAWFLRKNRGAAGQVLSKQVIEVLGRMPLANRQQLQLVRIGSKLLLVSVTPNGAETLTEITDPLEVERLTGRCRENQPNSISQSFQQVLEQFGAEPADGFLDQQQRSELELARGSRRRQASLDA